MQNNTILIVDDESINLDILGELLNQYDVVYAISGKDALQIIDTETIGLILLDIKMPQMDGYEVCRKLKSNDKTKDIPVIFITANVDEDSIEKAYDLGGTDYITKPFRAKELLSRIKKELKYNDMVKELKMLASTDPMTKLYNRRYFTEISAHTLDLMKREKENLSIIMLDIDKFKNINDIYGHQMGDEVIITLANKLIQHQRKSDIICRYGGDEFVILLPNTSVDGASVLVQKTIEDIESLTISFPLNKDIKFTLSVGVSQVDLENESTIELALKRADNALYDAKTSGRNKVCIKA